MPARPTAGAAPALTRATDRPAEKLKQCKEEREAVKAALAGASPAKSPKLIATAAPAKGMGHQLETLLPKESVAKVAVVSASPDAEGSRSPGASSGFHDDELEMLRKVCGGWA